MKGVAFKSLCGNIPSDSPTEGCYTSGGKSLHGYTSVDASNRVVFYIQLPTLSDQYERCVMQPFCKDTFITDTNTSSAIRRIHQLLQIMLRFFWLMSEASWNNMFWFWKQIFFFFSYITRWLIRDKWSSLWHPTNWARAFQHRGFYSGKFKTRAMSLWRGSKGLLKLTLSWGSREIATKKLQEQSHSVDSGSAF